MSTQITPTVIANRAVQKVGGLRIADGALFTEDSKNAAEIAACYDTIRRHELRRNVWRFSIRRATLNAITATTQKIIPTTWVSTISYPSNAIVTYNGFVYISVAPANLGNIPDPNSNATAGNFWQLYFGNLYADVWGSSATANAVVSGTLPALPLEDADMISVASLAIAKAFFAAGIVVTHGQTMFVSYRATINDGYGGTFAYDSTDTTTSFAADGLGFVDNNSRRWKRVFSGPASLGWFNIIQDGATDNTSALNVALAAFQDFILPIGQCNFNGTVSLSLAGTQLRGLGTGSIFKLGNSAGKFQVNASQCTLATFAYTGQGNGNGIDVGPSGSVTNTTVMEIIFSAGCGPCVQIFTASIVTVVKCTFNHVTYGVLGAQGFTNDTIKILFCEAEDMLADFANFNSDGSGSCQDVLVEGNTYKGANNWAAGGTELRFLSVTSTTYVQCKNNWVKNVGGDAAVHAEDVGGQLTITGNTFIDCNVAGGNDGYIYFLSSTQNMLIEDNWFIKTVNGPTGNQSAISFAGNALSSFLNVGINYVFGPASKNMNGINLSAYAGNLAMIEGLVGVNLTDLITLNSTSNVHMKNLRCFGCTNGIYDRVVLQASGAGGIDIQVEGCVLDCTTICLKTGSNTGATGGPLRWHVTNNVFRTGIVSGTDMTDTWMALNKFSNGMATHSLTLGTPVRVVQANWNFLDGTGIV